MHQGGADVEASSVLTIVDPRDYLAPNLDVTLSSFIKECIIRGFLCLMSFSSRTRNVRLGIGYKRASCCFKLL